ncbi:MAG: SIP domain-containing protein, partial [Microbacterium sp.]|uniref:siderophore-interacting protein n=1 Tax=Microbacterium sp. TaxID=51671 RepID=UPI0039E528A7
LVLVGPRTSRSAPQRAPRVLLAVDGTALPAAGRWIAELPVSTTIEVVADIAGDLGWVEDYLLAEGGRRVPIRPAGPELADAVAAVGVDAETFVFAASEASRLVGLRRHLRGLGLARDQFALHGYWKRGHAGPDEA